MRSTTGINLVCAAFLLLNGALSATAQFNKLDSLSGYHLKVYFSKGQKERATQMAIRSHNAIVYADSLINFRPNVSLLVLSPLDWPQYTKFPVYGMPHYTNDQTLVVATEDNALWKSFLPPMDQLPPSLAEQIKKVYKKDEALTMQPFFDLLALHELGHAFHMQASLNMQRKWMGEFFCNLFLHTYIAEREPQLLPALSIFPNMVVAGGTRDFTFTTLEQFESKYEEIAMQHPRNYGWYQCRLHVAAGKAYDAGGKDVLVKLWRSLKSKDNRNDKEFGDQLVREVHPVVGEVVLKW
ncbi:MAG: hypothetical protein H7Y42_06095 [Chitinophagaceae bacterium]|nr:hypothetical protein [Chitinophagaceae bacterium]